MNYACYADLTDAKSRMSISDTAEDAAILHALETASRWLENRCGRHFSVRSETRYFTALYRTRLLIDDLLSITTLKTLTLNSGGTRTYGDTWAATDYDLEPYNGFPKTAIQVNSGGSYSFPSDKRGVEIAGSWGWGNASALANDGTATPYEDSGTDTAEELDASETGVDVVAGSALAVGQTILVESEQMYITAIASNTATVRRGVNGTTAATHVTAKDVNIYRYPDDIREACVLRAIQLLRGTEAPFNVVEGLANQGAIQPANLWVRILDLIGPFREGDSLI